MAVFSLSDKPTLNLQIIDIENKPILNHCKPRKLITLYNNGFVVSFKFGPIAKPHPLFPIILDNECFIVSLDQAMSISSSMECWHSLGLSTLLAKATNTSVFVWGIGKTSVGVLDLHWAFLVVDDGVARG